MKAYKVCTDPMREKNIRHKCDATWAKQVTQHNKTGQSHNPLNMRMLELVQ